jgi:sugar phosphate isomerase/epimerase
MKTVGLTICFCLVVLSAPAIYAREAPATNAFYAMDTNVWSWKDRTPEQVAKLLKDLGYDGYGHGGTQNIDEYLAALDAQGLGLFSTYVTMNLDAEAKVDPAVADVFRKFKGRNAMLWLIVRSRKYARDSEAGDAIAVEAIRRLADDAHEQGVKIALYPHTGDYAESLDDAIRIAEKVNRRNVGVTFNLCHWLKVEGDKDPAGAIKRAMPYLFQVSINGADSGDTKAMNWSRLIQPLGSGTYDVGGVLKTLKELGYAGPIALQGYGVKGDSKENLKRSIQAWRKLSDSLKSAEHTLRHR